MKKFILAVLVMSVVGCASPFKDAPPTAPKGSYTQFITFGDDVPDNCKAYSADVYLFNGVPALLYMCNK